MPLPLVFPGRLLTSPLVLAPCLLLSFIFAFVFASGASAACTQSSFDSAAGPTSIPDPPASAESTVSVPTNGLIDDVDVRIEISHPFDSDLRIELLPPSGTPVLLAQAIGMWGDDFTGTTFDDDATDSVISELPPFDGSFRPVEPLTTLDGSSAGGVWKLRVSDRFKRYDGTIEAFGIDIVTCSGAAAAQARQIAGASQKAGAPQTPPPLPDGVPTGDEGIEGTAITATTVSDTSDGDTSGAANLQASPGADGGISLREAIEATNNDPGTYTIGFAPSLAGATLERNSPLPELTGGGVFINGDIDGDGHPDVTLTEAEGVGSVGFLIASGRNRLHALGLEGFDRNVSLFHTPGVQTYAQNVVSGLVMGDVGSEGIGGFGNPAEPGTQWNDTRLIGNTIDTARGGIELFQLSGEETANRLAIVGNAINMAPREGGGGSGIAPFSGHGAHANRMADLLIAYNSIDGTTFDVGIGVASGSSGGDSNTVERLQVLGNHLDLEPHPLAIGVGAGDGGGPVGFPENNLMRDVEISGNAVDAGQGISVAGGCCGAASNAVENARIDDNVIRASHERGVAVVAAGTGGQFDQASAENTVAEVVVDSNTIEHSQMGPLGPGSLLWGGIVLIGGEGADNGRLTNARISNNDVDSRFIGIDVVGGFGLPDQLPGNDNLVSQLDLEDNVVTAPVAVTPTYPWARGISLIGGIEDATGNDVSCDLLAGNLVAGVLNDLGVRENVDAGASGNGVTLGDSCAPPLPPAPKITVTDPVSPANANDPKVKGTVGGSPVEVNIYKNATCAGAPSATGTAAEFTGAGIAITVADNTTTALSARAIGAAANESPCSSSRFYTEDSTPPATTIVAGPSGTITSTTATLKFSSSAAGSSFQCRLDSGVWTGCTPPKTYAALSQGPHAFYVRASDRAGNTDPTPASRSFRVDTKVTGAEVSAARVQRQRRRVKVKVGATASELVTAKATGNVKLGRRGLRLKPQSKRIDGGERATLILKAERRRADKRILRALKRHRKVTAIVTVKLRDQVGNSTQEKLAVRLK